MRPRRVRGGGGLIAGGAVLFGVGYLIAFSEALTINSIPCAVCTDTYWLAASALYIPVVGPWIGAGLGATAGWHPAAVAVNVLIGAMQVGGLAMIIGGARQRAEAQQYDEASARRSRSTAWSIMPMATPESVGLGLSVVNY